MKNNADVIVENVKLCPICHGPIDRYVNRFQCRSNPVHMGDLNTGIITDCSYPGRMKQEPIEKVVATSVKTTTRWGMK